MQQPPRGPMRPHQQMRQQFSNQVEKVQSSRELASAAACVIGGIVVVLLSLIGAAGEVTFLQNSGYGWSSLVLWLLAIGAGVAIWREVPFATYGAAGIVVLDFLLQIVVMYGMAGKWPEWFIVLKFILLLVVIQAVYDPEDEDEVPPGPQRMGPGQMPGPRRMPPGPRR